MERSYGLGKFVEAQTPSSKGLIFAAVKAGYVAGRDRHNSLYLCLIKNGMAIQKHLHFQDKRDQRQGTEAALPDNDM
jgi:hypothetical protein